MGATGSGSGRFGCGEAAPGAAAQSAPTALVAAVLVAALGACPVRAAEPPAVAASPRPATIRLRVRVASCPPSPGAPLVPAQPASWVDEQVEGARALLAPHGIAIVADQNGFVPARCEILTRADRDDLAEHVTQGRAVTVLVVPRVRDLDVPSYDLMGVHWRAGGRRWIFLTARARSPVLAHELGHYFGLPHDPAGGNLMTPGPSSPLWRSPRPPRSFAPVLTADQVRRLRAAVVSATARHP
jgi:hypothetical protein